MKKRSNIGHLVRIENTATGHREFTFLYILDDDPPNAYKTVIKGIRNLRLPVHLRKTAKIEADPVTDYTRVDRDFPDTIGSRMYNLPVTSFYRTKEKTFKESLFLNGVKNVIEKNGDFFPTNRLTAVATGSDFFARNDILTKIWKRIKKGQNVIICGPRRYGKTSIMRRIKDEASFHGYKPVMIDLESTYSPQELVARIQVEVEHSNWNAVEKDNKISELSENLIDQWADKGKKLFTKISKRKGNFLFILDEVPYMLESYLGKDKPDSEKINTEDKERTEKFVVWFKKQRESLSGRCVFLFAGSIDLKPYLKDNGLDKDSFSDCREIRLSFFEDEIVRDYIEGLLLGQEIVLSDDIIAALVNINRPGIPYFIQVVMTQVVSLYRKNPDFSAENLDAMYQEKIIGLDSRRFFDSFERHFKRYGKRKPGAFAILKELAEAGYDGLKKEKLEKIFSTSSYQASKSEFDILLKYLEHDFYIENIKQTDRYRFASPILRDYWKKNQ